ncbi:hypothetical protein [Maridesulfovibrio sp.]|uniref:hypothetical protein n=1 Tax=Maridesulfovibrio sp. TaxID=2795000 RepID=UPI002A187382|nr:hypothetical protein [Maridesulfovibrio sp.]
MRKYPSTLIGIIEKSGLNLNSISKLSGVSNTYLTKLSRNKINHPGKDKIASILLALNHRIADINSVLAEYDYQPLNRHDIPAILNNNRRRKVEGPLMPHYDRLYFELMLVVFEHIGGSKIVIKDTPSGIYQPYELYMMKEFQLELDGEAERFLYNLTGQVVLERLQLFKENCTKGHKITTYMCRECLEETLDKTIGKAVANNDMGRLQLFSRFLANATACAIKFPEQHKLRITERCSMFEFLIQNADGKKPVLNFTGNSRHSFNNPYDQHNLEGFSTTSPNMLNLFKIETDMCEAAASKDRRNTPEGFRDYISGKFDEWKVGHLFDEAMEELMDTSEFKIF